MKKLKTILQSNYLYIFIIVITILYSVYYIKIIDHKSIYKINDNNFNLTIKDIKYNGNKITLKLSGKEPLIGTFYVDNINELEYYKNNLEYGQKVEIKGELNKLKNNTIPNTFNYKKYLYYNHIFYNLNINKIKITKKPNKIFTIKNKLYKRIIKIDKKGYINAFILGNKDNIDTDIYNKYQICGISHLFAISGMHIGLISSILLLLLKNTNSIIKYTIVDIILLLYCYILNFPASLLRCTTFYIINSINKLFKLNISTLKIFIITISLIIIHNPFIIYNTGFQFSACIVFGIIYYSNIIKGNYIIKSIKLSTITFLFSLPISLSSFYSINLFSIIYNLFYIPYITLIVYPLSIITLLIPQIYPILNIFINILENSVSLLSNLKVSILYLNLNIYEVVVFYIILIITKKNIKLITINMLIIIVDILLPFFDSNCYIYFFDVQQGDSSLIIKPYRKEVILIDTGGISTYQKEEWQKRKEVKVSDNYIQFMHSIGINKINYIIITHGDFDHCGDATNILEKMYVKELIFNNDSYNELEKEIINHKKIKYTKNPDNISNIKIYNTNKYDNENNNSNVILLNIYNKKILFTGDAGINREKDLIKEKNLKNINILKVGHHGSDTSSSVDFIKYTNPKYSIISVGEKNRYGHPKDEVLENLKKSKIFRTDIDGTIKIIINKNRLNIKTYQP